MLTPDLRQRLLPRTLDWLTSTNPQVSNDFGSYLAAEKLVDELWLDQEEWTKKSIRTAFSMGDFSSDRAIQDYADSVSAACGEV